MKLTIEGEQDQVEAVCATITKTESWAKFRRRARYYERELKRIVAATNVDAARLKEFAARALASNRH